MLVILLAGILGVCAAIGFDVYVPANLSSYAAIVIIAAADSAIEGCKSLIRDRFDIPVFVTGFFGNSVFAAFMVFLGKKIELDLYYAVLIVFTLRIFNNFSFIRMYYLKKISKKLKKC